MRKQVLKIVALIGAAALMLTLPGCFGQKPKPPAGNLTSGVSKDPITLKLNVINDNVSFPAGVQNDAVAKELAKQTGVTMDIENITQDYNNRISVMLASGDLPDITLFGVQYTDLIDQAIKSGNIIDLADLVAKYAPNYSNDPAGKLRMAWAKKFASNGTNKLYFFNGQGDTNDSNFEVVCGNFVRADLWKKMGYPEIPTTESYLTLLKQMQDIAEPTKDGKKPYAMGTWFADSKGWAEWPMYFNSGKYQEYGNGAITYNCWDLKPMRGYYTDKESPLMASLRWYNKAYRMGILDPESATMKYDQYLDKVKSGRLLHTYGNWMDDDANANFAKDGHPEKGFMPLNSPKDLPLKWPEIRTVRGQNYLAVSKNCKYPERAVAFLDYLFSWDGAQLIQNGVKGEHWDVVDGKPQWKDDVIEKLLNDSSYKAATGISKYCIALQLRGSNAIDPRYGTGIGLSNQPKFIKQQVTQPYAKEYLDHYQAKSVIDMINKEMIRNGYVKPTEEEKKNRVVLIAPENEVLEPDTEEFKRILNATSDYVHNNVAKIVYAETEEEFNKLLDKWVVDMKAIGTDRYEADNMRRWNEGVVKVNEFLKENKQNIPPLPEPMEWD